MSHSTSRPTRALKASRLEIVGLKKDFVGTQYLTTFLLSLSFKTKFKLTFWIGNLKFFGLLSVCHGGTGMSACPAVRGSVRSDGDSLALAVTVRLLSRARTLLRQPAQQHTTAPQPLSLRLA